MRRGRQNRLYTPSSPSDGKVTVIIRNVYTILTISKRHLTMFTRHIRYIVSGSKFYKWVVFTEVFL